VHINVIHDNALAIARLNDNAEWAIDPKATRKIDGREWSGEEVVQAAVNALTYAIESHCGFGFNSAGRTMCKHAEAPLILGLLIAYGATPRTSLLHGIEITERIHAHGRD
jgi:hypothetical protein